MKRPGRTRIKLAAMLTKALTESEGFAVEVDAEDIWQQEGDYRKTTWDLARWGVNLDVRNPEGARIHLSVSSWDRMGDCIRGLTITKTYRGLPGDRDVNANTVKP